MFEFEDNLANAAKIKVIGIGGGGGNAVRTMIRSRLDGVEFLVANTDVQALQSNEAMVKIQLGAKITKGLGAGSNPDMGRDAALEDVRTIQEALSGADMVFITAGMGGGTGTGAAPVIGRVAREMGILAVAVVTMPFAFEGRKRIQRAEIGVQALKDEVDTLLMIPNEKLLHVSGKETPLLDAFKMADNVLFQAVRGISDLITIPGLINLDFADVRTVMKETGMAIMGTGVGRGENRAMDAAKMAISSPLLDNVSVTGARGILLNVTGPSSMTLFEVNEASKLIQQEVHEDANIIFGAVIDDKIQDEIRVTLVATGFGRVDESKKLFDLRESQSNKVTLKSWNDYQKNRETKTSGEEEDISPAVPVQAAPAPSYSGGQFSTRPVDRPGERSSERVPERVADRLPERAPDRAAVRQMEEPERAAPRVEVEGTTQRSLFPGTPVKATLPARSLPRSQAPAEYSSSLGSVGTPSYSAPKPAPAVMASYEEEPQSSSYGSSSLRRRDFPSMGQQDLKKIVAEIGMTDIGDDEYDIPAFIRRRAD